jgi:hypothetical protein
MHENKMLKNMYKINIPSVHLKKIIFVPMLAPKFKAEESLKYETKNLTPGTMDNPIKHATNDSGKNPNFITDKK